MFVCRYRRCSGTIKLDTKRFDNLLESEIVHFAQKLATPLEKQAILDLKDPKQAGEVLLRELPVRFAARIKDLKSLPGRIEEFQKLRDIFATSFKHLRTRSIVTRADIGELKTRHQKVTPLLLQGLRKAQAQKLLGTREVDEFCNRFFLSRIGTEMLTSQYLSIDSPQHGILKNVDPVAVAKWAVASISDLTRKTKGVEVASKISYYGPKNATVLYPPSYLFYILSELLKNSFRAHCEYRRRDILPKDFDPVYEQVEIIICADEGRFAIKVEDRGGGIPVGHEEKIWSFLYSTAETPELDSELTPLAGFGVGLPLSRLYANYLGGSLKVVSLPNCGTHAFLFLTRDVTVEEQIPEHK